MKEGKANSTKGGSRKKNRQPTPVCEAEEHGSRLPINQSIQNATIWQSNNVVLSQTD